MSDALCHHLLRKHIRAGHREIGVLSSNENLASLQSVALEVYVRRHCSSVKEFSWPQKLNSVRVLPLRAYRIVSDAQNSDGIASEILGSPGNLHADFVDACVLIALKQGSGSGNYHKRSVLALGKRLGRVAGKHVALKHGGGNNAVLKFLKNHAWSTLHDAVGDHFMQHLLLDTAMFHGKRTKVQLTGPLLSAQVWSAGPLIDSSTPQQTEELLIQTNQDPGRKVVREYKVLDRREMLYAANFNRHVGLPKLHELNDKDMTARRLAKTILGNHPSNLGYNEIRNYRVWCGVLLKNHRRCPYGGLLRRYCPATAWSKSLETENENIMSLQIPPRSVSEFLKAVLLRLLGRAPLTSQRRTRRRLLEAVHTFAHLSRNANFNLSQEAERIGLPECLVVWLFERLIVPLTKVCFYCTEGTGTGSTLLYFRKTLWDAVCQKEIKSMQNTGILKPLLATSASVPANQISKLRFVPKANGGLRPIMNCKGSNFRLAFVSHVLKAEFRNPQRDLNPARPQILGLNEFYLVYKNFVQGLGGGSREMHILTMDVEKCFDNLDQSKVCQAVSGILKQEDYTITGYNQVFMNNKLTKRIRSIAHKHVEVNLQGLDAGDAEPIFRTIFDRARNNTASCILIDRAEGWHVGRSEITRKVSQHIKTHLTKFGARTFCQGRGIPQGSILSSLLCSICIDQFEKLYVDPILFSQENSDKNPGQSQEGPASALCVRMLDDFLVISTNPDRLRSFQLAMERGFPDFGLRVKASKTVVSSPDQVKIPWCGYLFNSSDLTVTLDESRLNFRSTKKPQVMANPTPVGVQLREAAQIISLRCAPLLFDRSINPVHIAKHNLAIVLRLAKNKLDQHARATCAAKLVTFIYRLILTRTKSNSALTRHHVRQVLQVELDVPVVGPRP